MSLRQTNLFVWRPDIPTDQEKGRKLGNISNRQYQCFAAPLRRSKEAPQRQQPVKDARYQAYVKSLYTNVVLKSLNSLKRFDLVYHEAN